MNDAQLLKLVIAALQTACLLGFDGRAYFRAYGDIPQEIANKKNERRIRRALLAIEEREKEGKRE